MKFSIKKVLHNFFVNVIGKELEEMQVISYFPKIEKYLKIHVFQRTINGAGIL